MGRAPRGYPLPLLRVLLLRHLLLSGDVRHGLEAEQGRAPGSLVGHHWSHGSAVAPAGGEGEVHVRSSAAAASRSQTQQIQVW